MRTEIVRGANRDQIVDFNRAQRDRIDLSTIDADTDGTAGNQKFTFIGTQAFNGVDGELRCSGRIIQGDVNGDRVADFEIKVNLATLSPAISFSKSDKKFHPPHPDTVPARYSRNLPRRSGRPKLAGPAAHGEGSDNLNAGTEPAGLEQRLSLAGIRQHEDRA